MWLQLRKAEICSFHLMMLRGALKPKKLNFFFLISWGYDTLIQGFTATYFSRNAYGKNVFLGPSASCEVVIT